MINFSKSKSYVILLNPMLTSSYARNKNTSPHFEMEYDDFNKCLCLTNFMKKYSFPTPNMIQVVPDQFKSSLLSASVIKYANGPDWKNIKIDDRIDSDDITTYLKWYLYLLGKHGKDPENTTDTKGIILLIDSEKNQLIPKNVNYPKLRNGDAILFEDNNLESMVQKFTTGKMPPRAIIQNTIDDLDGWDSLDGPDFSGFKKYNYPDNLCHDFNTRYVNQYKKPADQEFSTNQENKSANINNKYNIGNEDFSNKLSEFVQTFTKDYYSMKLLSKGSEK